MMLPTIHWTLDAKPVHAMWSEALAELSGYHRATLRVPAHQARRAHQGSVISARQSNGRIMWEGRLVTIPAFNDEYATLEAVGYKAAAEKAQGRLLYKSIDPSVWEDEGSNVGFSIVGPDIIASGAGSLIVVSYFPGIAGGLTRYDDTATNVYFGVAKGGWVAAASGGYAPAGGPYDSLKVTLSPSAAGATAIGEVYGSGNSDDTMTASEAVADIAGRLGWDTSGITSTNVNILPMDLQGSWSNALDYLASTETWRWRVLDDRGNGPYLDFGGFETEWHAYRAAGTMVDVTPIEVYNRVVVWYSDGTSSPKMVEVMADPDPLAGSGLVNTFEHRLGDQQDDPTLATSTAYSILEEVATQRHSGQVVVYETEQGTPYDILPGDLLTVPDWQPWTPLTGRVSSVSYTPGGITVGMETGALRMDAAARFAQAEATKRTTSQSSSAAARSLVTAYPSAWFGGLTPGSGYRPPGS